MSKAHLSGERREILRAATARLLPSDDGPGARETGAADYVEAALVERSNRHLVELFDEGLDFFQLQARQLKNKDFLACQPEEQDEVLHAVQQYPNNDARRFFESLLELTIEGFLCDPVHGGNRDRLGWEYVGYTGEGSATRPCMGKRPS